MRGPDWLSFIWTEHPPTRIFSHTHLRTCTGMGQDYSSLCSEKNLHIISTPSMFAHERSSPPSSLSSSSSTSSNSQVTLPIGKHCDDPQNEEFGSVAKTAFATGYEPNVIDNFDYSETHAAIFQNESVDVDTEPSYSFDAKLDDELVRKALSPTTVHSGARRISEPETNLSLSWGKFVASSVLFHTSSERPVHEQSSDLSQ